MLSSRPGLNIVKFLDSALATDARPSRLAPNNLPGKLDHMV